MVDAGDRMREYHKPSAVNNKKNSGYRSVPRPLVFIGQAPARRPNGQCSGRVAAMLGLDPEDFRDRYTWMNVLVDYPGKHGKGDAFDLKMARCAAISILDQLKGATIVLLGRNVARAFHISGDYFTVHEKSGAVFVLFPHPSTINRFWNSEANTARASNFLRQLSRQLSSQSGLRPRGSSGVRRRVRREPSLG